MGPAGPRRSSRLPAGRCSSGACGRCGRWQPSSGSSSRFRRIALDAAPGGHGVRWPAARPRSQSVRAALGRRGRRRPGDRPRRRPAAGRARAVRAGAGRARALRRRRGDRGGARVGHDQGGGRGRTRRWRGRSTERRLWAVQTPQVFRRAALERASRGVRRGPGRGHRRRLAGGAAQAGPCAWSPVRRRTSR